MRLINTVDGLRKELSGLRKTKQTVGFVPTMGALHKGHLSLVKQSLAENDICVVSIFVNPTQFNDKEDLKKYPRDIEKDCQLLTTVSDKIIVFNPSESEIYPEPDTRCFDFGQIDKVMEGKYRPGHFNGVAQVVSRLFDIVKPDKAYFGEKDFQQLAVIRDMARQLRLGIQIVPMPIVREENGLALSSRNELLTPSQKIEAAKISEELKNSKAEMYKRVSVPETIHSVTERLNKVEGMTVEYFEIVDGITLQPIENWYDTEYVVGCIAVYLGKVRLIDNIEYSKNDK